jgi:hypothetical protein
LHVTRMATEANPKNLSRDGAAAIPKPFGIYYSPLPFPKMIDNLFNSFTCHAVPGLSGSRRTFPRATNTN